jgi:hypothetical protein
VRWNEKSGAAGEPVRRMPVIFLHANHETQELTEVGRSRTDSEGQFAFIGDASIDTSVMGEFKLAANIPHQVVSELNRKVRTSKDNEIIEKLHKGLLRNEYMTRV